LSSVLVPHTAQLDFPIHVKLEEEEGEPVKVNSHVGKVHEIVDCEIERKITFPAVVWVNFL